MRTLSHNLFKCLFMLLVLLGTSCSTDEANDEMEQIEMLPEDPAPNPDPNPTSQVDITAVDDAVTSFMSQYGVPGAALAVSVNGNMVYSKGYGLANVEENTATQADDVFRLASVTKVITSAAIFRLVEQGEITLDDKVFGPDGILGEDFRTATLTQDHLNMSIINLLQFELGGWGTFNGQDPIDAFPDFNFNQFMEFVFNERPLSNGPGETHAYTNMAQWLCARVIEEVSGQSFQDYVNSILSPAGISSFKTTSFRQNDREPNEVEYYDANEMQFIYSITSRRDGDAGGVMSAPDVLRFLNAIDGFSSRPDIISSESHEILTSPSRFNEFWGAGLAPWPAQNLLWMNGSLPGNRSWVMVGDNQVNAVILLNFNNRNNQDFTFDFQDVMLFIVNNNSIPWQTNLDQF